MRQRVSLLGTPFLLLAVLTLISFLPVRAQVTWSIPERLTNQRGTDISPAILQALDGQVYVVWQSDTAVDGKADIYLRTWDGTRWSAQTRLVTDKSHDANPSIAQLGNGTIIVAWNSNRTNNMELFFKTFNGRTWSEDIQMTSDPLDDKSPSIIATKGGVLWVAWSRQMASGDHEIFYKTSSGVGWSPEVQLTFYSGHDLLSAVRQMKDGRVWIVWSRFTSPDYELYGRIWNGNAWSQEIRLTQSNLLDLRPAINQDRDGTIWVFWSREMPAGGPLFQDEIFYKTSLDNGATWSADVQLTVDPDPANLIEDISPAATQGADHSLWLTWASTQQDDDWEIYLMKSSPISTHDIAVTNMGFNPIKLKPGGIVSMVVVAENLGDFPETFQVNVYYNVIQIWTQTITLDPGKSMFLYPSWNTTGVKPGRYPLYAQGVGVVSETLPNRADNTFQAGIVHVLPPGDVDWDGDVDIFDAARLSVAYNTKPGDLKWDPQADLNNDGKVSIIDAAILGFWYGTKT